MWHRGDMADDDVPQIPFRPESRGFPGFPMPPTVPSGLRLELSRCPVVEGQEETLGEWMSMLTPDYLRAAMQQWGTTGTAE